ncbi:MAG TPA: chorismate synthase [Bacteroidia bacterium]|nr:chorismate synthase [Bacteroidia bacterium]
MASNFFGSIFRFSTFGESHGKLIGVLIDGCPAGYKLNLEFIQHQLNRRKPSSSQSSTARKEDDIAEVLSGVHQGISTGAPLCIVVQNKDARPVEYESIRTSFRPSHADYTYYKKYGTLLSSGAGRASARETLARVIAGAIAQDILQQAKISIQAYVSSIGKVKLRLGYHQIDLNQVDQYELKCPHKDTHERMLEHLEDLKKLGDSTGGIITCIIKNCPAGLGEPIYSKLDAELAYAMMGINAVHGFEYGSGFAGSALKGSENNDAYVVRDNEVSTTSNNAGGILGGISTGMDIYFNVAFKPVSSIAIRQETVNVQLEQSEISVNGRHDVCVVPRAVPVVESMAAVVILNAMLQNKSSRVDTIF